MTDYGNNQSIIISKYKVDGKNKFDLFEIFVKHFVKGFIITLLILLIIHHPPLSFAPELSDCLLCWV